MWGGGGGGGGVNRGASAAAAPCSVAAAPLIATWRRWPGMEAARRPSRSGWWLQGPPGLEHAATRCRCGGPPAATLRQAAGAVASGDAVAAPLPAPCAPLPLCSRIVLDVQAPRRRRAPLCRPWCSVGQRPPPANRKRPNWVLSGVLHTCVCGWSSGDRPAHCRWTRRRAGGASMPAAACNSPRGAGAQLALWPAVLTVAGLVEVGDMCVPSPAGAAGPPSSSAALPCWHSLEPACEESGAGHAALTSAHR